MTHPSAAQKRKRKREQKLLEEESRQVEEETAHHLPVSTPSPLPPPAAPVPEPSAHMDADPEPYDWYPPSDRLMFDAAVLVFIDDEPTLPALHAPPESSFPNPKDWPADIRAFPSIHAVGASPSAISFRKPNDWPADIHSFVYGSVPAEAKPLSWFDDVPDVPTMQTVYTGVPSPLARNCSALRSESAHPWRTIRRKNCRLLPQRSERRQFPRSFPKPATISAPRADILNLYDHLPVLPPPPAPPPSVVDAVDTSPSSMLPAQTTYGPVNTRLALACALEQPHAVVTLEQIFDLVWGPHVEDVHKNLVAELPADQLVFLGTLVRIASLEPVFTGFLHPAITEFVNGWVTHCC
ncbi:hypothetical protein FB451DRAFT_1273181 [Mycena latifolia]|nr:hypothetical protein FB451DRAFT_1273181 [Mycena latifolia]